MGPYAAGRPCIRGAAGASCLVLSDENCCGAFGLVSGVVAFHVAETRPGAGGMSLGTLGFGLASPAGGTRLEDSLYVADAVALLVTEPPAGAGWVLPAAAVLGVACPAESALRVPAEGLAFLLRLVLFHADFGGGDVPAPLAGV